MNTISSSEDEFDGAKDEYQKALEDAGYTGKITYDPVPSTGVQPKRKRRRRIFWFNPPYSKSVSTNIGKEFFKLLGLHFPNQHPFLRLFNDNTVNLSYSCMPSMDSIVKEHNMKILREEEEADAKEERGCNCRDKTYNTRKPKSLVVLEGRPDFSFLFKSCKIDRSQGRLVK